MKRLRLFTLLGVLALLLLAGLLAAAPIAKAQSGGGYDLSWSTVDGGGGTSTGGAYALSGTIGQADAGAQAGGTYTVVGGFWASFTQALYRLYAPLVTK